MTFDLNAVAAEALGEPFTFTWGDGDEQREFSIGRDVDIRWLTSLQGGNLRTALIRLLGADQFAEFDATSKPFGAEHFSALVKAYNEHLGGGPGKSRPSSKRSKSTAPRSRQISSSSTR